VTFLPELRRDLRVLAAMARGQERSGSHAEKLEAFYGPQAADYDAFRARLLHGREELVRRIALPYAAQVAELGAGTGATAALFKRRMSRIWRFDLVDLCPSLLAQARARFAGSRNVRVLESDVLAYRPAAPLDAVYFSYSLTMIPDWKRALEHALSLLKPEGLLGIVDFIAPPGSLGRRFWTRWFGHDGVRLDRAHLEGLRARTEAVYFREGNAPLPYLPFVKVPYYVYVGRLPAGS
jgi:S-adenosylmethionine-diacylgycerolhomoserine-N-methlytransferase